MMISTRPPRMLENCSPAAVAIIGLREKLLPKNHTSQERSASAETLPSLCSSSSSSSASMRQEAQPQLQQQRRRFCPSDNDHLSERAIVLVAESTNWNPFLLSKLACVCKRMDAITKRVLWKRFCLSRAPKMVTDLLKGAKNGHIEGGWQPLAKLLLYCAGDQQQLGCGEEEGQRKKKRKRVAVKGHFVHKTRFSRTAGKSFLVPQCRADVLYVTDGCEHAVEEAAGGKEEEDDEAEDDVEEEDDVVEEVGLFRGIFRGFNQSDTMKLLTQRRAQLDKASLCPFCRAKGWRMGAARMVPKSAARRLAAHNDQIDFFVCLNGHVNGTCALLPLSDDEEDDEDCD